MSTLPALLQSPLSILFHRHLESPIQGVWKMLGMPLILKDDVCDVEGEVSGDGG